MKRFFYFIATVIMGISSYGQTGSMNSKDLLLKIQTELGRQKGVFALAYKDISSGETILWNEHEMFHAASTMKTPVMIEVFKQVAEGKRSLSDRVLVKTEFTSIVDTSVYQLNPADDSEQDLYKLAGTRIPLSDLIYRMITSSSNLATNIIIEMVGGKNVTQTMRALGANDIQVLRGVEDNKAFAKGLNNSTTAYDLMLIFQNMAEGKIINQGACDEMIKVLLHQTHNTLIPAFLPKEVKVAHKTGTITGVHHDSGIVFLPDGRKYVVVFLSKNIEDDTNATLTMARASEMIYQYMISKGKQ